MLDLKPRDEVEGEEVSREKEEVVKVCCQPPRMSTSRMLEIERP